MEYKLTALIINYDLYFSVVLKYHGHIWNVTYVALEQASSTTSDLMVEVDWSCNSWRRSLTLKSTNFSTQVLCCLDTSHVHILYQ